MNWTTISALSEMIGSAAVVISLLYLASQIRAQNRESRIASVHQVTEAFRIATSSLQATGPADVFARGIRDFDALAEAEQIQFIAIFHAFYRSWEEAFYHWQHGRLDERVWGAMVAHYSQYLGLPGFQRVWQIRKNGYSKEFRNFADSCEPTPYLTA